MEAPDELAQRIADLAGHLLIEETVQSSLDRVANLAVSFLPSCDACGVAMVTRGEIATRVATDAMAQRVDSHQYAVGEGPCIEAVRTGRPLRVDSLAAEVRWPRFVPQAIEEGVVSSFSVPLKVHGETVGALNLYSRERAFDDQDETVVDMFASQVAVALSNAQAFQRIRDLVDQLTEAMVSRDVIGQAKGIIMERTGCGPDEAFDTLRSTSQAGNVKLHVVAGQVIDSATGPHLRHQPGEG